MSFKNNQTYITIFIVTSRCFLKQINFTAYCKQKFKNLPFNKKVSFTANMLDEGNQENLPLYLTMQCDMIIIILIKRELRRMS